MSLGCALIHDSVVGPDADGCSRGQILTAECLVLHRSPPHLRCRGAYCPLAGTGGEAASASGAKDAGASTGAFGGEATVLSAGFRFCSSSSICCWGCLRLPGMVACYVILESSRRAQTNRFKTALRGAGCQDLKPFIHGSAASHDATLRISGMLTRVTVCLNRCLLQRTKFKRSRMTPSFTAIPSRSRLRGAEIPAIPGLSCLLQTVDVRQHRGA